MPDKRVVGRPAPQSFGALLRTFRQAASLSQEELAARAHVTVHAVSALERGLRTRPYPSTVRSLADALGLSADDRAALLRAVAGSRPTEQRPTAPETARPGPLPAPVSSLLAREQEVSELTGLLRERRLVTLTGPGGVGKTRLAVEIAHTLAESFRGAVTFVALAPVLDAELVPAAITDALGGADDLGAASPDADGVPGGGALAAAVHRLTERPALLVLDNFEHLLGASTYVANLLEACPALTVLVTSRAVLRLRGEHEFPVPPLSLPPTSIASAQAVEESSAGALFLARAREVVPGLALSDGEAAAVARICARLSGIPLALELAAAQTRLLDPTTLLARLDEAIEIDGSRDLPARQRTMRATLDWSYGLLTEPERSMLRTLSVFADGCRLADAEAVAAGAGTVARGRVLGLMQSLAEQSLLTTEHGRGRHRLSEPVAQYARVLLERAGEAERVQAAHTVHFLDLAERAAPEYQRAEQVEWLDRVDAEHGNMSAAFARALAARDGETAGRLGWALWLYWWMRGHAAHGRRLLEAVHVHPMPEHVRSRAETATATMCFREGDVAASRRWWQAGLDRARRLDDPLAQANGVAGIGLTHLASGDLATADSRFAEALPLCEQAGASGAWLHALAQVWRGTVALLRGEPGRAAASIEDGLASARQRGDRLSSYIALYNLSQVAQSTGDTAGARAHLEEGMRLSLETGDLANLAYLCEALAVVEAAIGRYERVAVLLGAGQRMRETIGRTTYGYYRPDVEAGRQAEQRARQRLGVDGFEDGLDRGRAMDAAGAVAFATGSA